MYGCYVVFMRRTRDFLGWRLLCHYLFWMLLLPFARAYEVEDEELLERARVATVPPGVEVRSNS